MLFRSVFAYDLIRKIFSDTLQESKIARETYLNSLTYEKLQALFTNAQTFEDIIFLLLGINNERSRKEVEKLKLLFKTHSWLLYFVELKHILFKISSVLKSADEKIPFLSFYEKAVSQLKGNVSDSDLYCFYRKVEEEKLEVFSIYSTKSIEELKQELKQEIEKEEKEFRTNIETNLKNFSLSLSNSLSKTVKNITDEFRKKVDASIQEFMK